MNIQTRTLIFRTVEKLLFLILLMPGFAVAAVGIGEAVLQSRMGEPLLARVDLSGERVDETCLSLLKADPLRDDVDSFLSEAHLALKAEGARQYVEISSPRPVGQAPIRLRLQVGCAGSRGEVKELTVSPVRKAGDEEAASLLARQKQLEASLLLVQQQLKVLQDESGAIRSRLEQLAAASPAMQPQPLAEPVQSASAGVPQSAPQPAVIEKTMGSPEEKTPPQNILTLSAGLLVIALVLWLGLRQRNRAALRAEPHLRRQAELAAAKAAAMGSSKAATQLVIKHPPQTKSAPPAAPAPPHKTEPKISAPPATHTAPPKAAGGPTEEDSLMEEAALYAASGRQARAIEILQEIIRRYPSRAEAWTLLLSLYSSLGKAAAFEEAAREFLRHHKASPAWSGIQALGRTLDHDNPLYADLASHPAHQVSVPHQPIGDVLIEMGILSKGELLGYLEAFDPRKHGRFGGYLVARKAISISQLDQALLQQQGLNGGAKPIKLPSLQDVEHFLADFDPKRHGSVSDYMALHHAATPEELDRVLAQQEPLQEAGGKIALAEEPEGSKT